MISEGVIDIGILVTAAFAVIGYLYRMGVDRRGAARTLAFHLYEIRHELIIEQPRLDKLIDEFKAEMREVVGERPNFRSLVVEGIPKGHIAAMLTSMNADLVRADQKLLDSYDSVLFAYSRVDPMLTHTIRGMKLLPILSRNFSDMKISFAGMMETFEEAETIQEHGQMEIDCSLDNTFRELMADLEKHIRKVSRKAGPLVWLSTRRLLKRTPELKNRTELTTSDLREMMERLFKASLLNNNLPDELRSQVEAATLDQIMDLFEAKLAEGADQEESVETS